MWLTGYPKNDSSFRNRERKGKPQKTLLLGASGRTGQLVLQLLQDRGGDCLAVVRNSNNFLSISEHEHLEIIKTELTNLSLNDWKVLLKGVDCIISCLGHNISLRGIWLPPYHLITNLIKNIARAVIDLNKEPLPLILISSNGVRLKDERFPKKADIGINKLIRNLVPPHNDNIETAQFLQSKEGYRAFEWVIVRPARLQSNTNAGSYMTFDEMLSSPFTGNDSVDRAHIADFIVKSVFEKNYWEEYKYRAPFIVSHGI